MTSNHLTSLEPRMQAALTELQGLISARYPAAIFAVDSGSDAEGIYVTATVDVEDADEVVELYIDRLVTLHVEEGLPLHVVPVRPIERVIQHLTDSRASRRPRAMAR